MPKIVATGALKGGAGKSMVIDNLAGCLAEDHKVILIDVDPQANASSCLGIDTADQDRLTIANILEDPSLDPALVTIKAPVEELPNLDLIPSSIKLFLTELRLVARGGRERIIFNYLEDNEAFFNQYEYILIDTNPSMGIVNQNAFFVADSIILVTDVSNNGVLGVEMFQYLWDEIRRDLRKEDNIHALVVNNYDQRYKLSKELLEYCNTEEHLAGLLVLPPIPYRVAYKETETAGKPINVFKRGSTEHKAFRYVLDELKRREVF